MADDTNEPTLAPTHDVIETLVAHRRAFLSFLERHVGDRALAEDLLQSAFARLDKTATLREGESAVAWFYRVLRNATIDHARRKAAESRKLSAFADELLSASAPSDEVERTICRCVATLKDTLKPSYREALERVELAGVAVKDYASEQGISSNNAAVRVFRAREALRTQVAAACGACAEHGCLDCTCRPH